MTIEHSEALDQIAARKSGDAIQGIADLTYSFDNEDPYQCNEVYEQGLVDGLALGRDAGQRLSPGEAQLYAVSVGEDGLEAAYFVGTEQEIQARLEALPDDNIDDDLEPIPDEEIDSDE